MRALTPQALATTMPKLHSLDLSEAALYGSSISAIAQLTALTRLSLGGRRDFSKYRANIFGGLGGALSGQASNHPPLSMHYDTAAVNALSRLSSLTCLESFRLDLLDQRVRTR